MSRAAVGRWGRSLAIRVPVEIARASGLAEGEAVEVEMQDGDIVIRRRDAQSRRRSEAEAAAAEIVADSRGHALGDVSIRDLLEEGRRG